MYFQHEPDSLVTSKHRLLVKTHPGERMLVSISPGEIAFTLSPSLPNSAAISRVSAESAACVITSHLSKDTQNSQAEKAYESQSTGHCLCGYLGSCVRRPCEGMDA